MRGEASDAEVCPTQRQTGASATHPVNSDASGLTAERTRGERAISMIERPNCHFDSDTVCWSRARFLAKGDVELAMKQLRR
jgi:hypothetical protein